MSNALASFLSRDWAGLVLAALVGAAGWFCVVSGSAAGEVWAAWLGYALLGVALLMALGSGRHLVHVARVRAKYPPPGKLVDVGGYRLHVLAEGNAGTNPAIVWIPGGHSPAFAFHHLHRMLRDQTRSILIDRPGTGWSDTGPFPRTTAVEAAEFVAALEKSGEGGPFVLVGHSFGGLLAANIARRRPDLVAGVVLLDATPADTIIYGPPQAALRRKRMESAQTALLHLFGIYIDLEERRWSRNPEAKRVTDLVEQRLGAAQDATRALGAGPGGAWAAASIYADLTPGGLVNAAWQTVVYDGDLGDLTVFLVAPGQMTEAEFESMPEAVAAKAAPDGGVAAKRLFNFFTRSRERYLGISTRAQRIYAPDGTGHNFPYETPDFVADVVRRFLTGRPEPGAA